MVSHVRFLSVLAAAFLLGCGVACAETRALVVGVSGYPNLPETIHLVGPKNDSREVANTLVRLGVPAGDVTVLADGVENLAPGIRSEGPGTKDAVLSALDRLANEAREGDLVVFYFSGHGSRQPDLNGDEQGGLDGIFLPYDVGKWTGDGVDKAIVDDELGERVQRILAKGADFFGIIDACHSSTGFRAVEGDDTRIRGIDPAELGVPAGTGEGDRALFTQHKAPPKGRGRAAYFYAAQENESALEKTPKGAAPGESYGVFTYAMLSRLAQSPDLTYRTLHEAVMADIKRNTLMATQTPDLEGELLDEPVLRLSGAAPKRQWPIWAGKLEAGQLAGLQNGAIVALYADPASPDADAVAYGVVENAGATRSVVSQIAWPCGAAVAADGSCPMPLDEAAFKKGRFARVVEPGIDLSVVLSEPVRVDPNDGRDYAAPLAALNAAVSSKALAGRVSLRRGGYDVAVALVDGKLAFSSSGGQVDADGPGSSPRLTLPDNPAAASATVASAVNRIARALALQRLGGGDAVQALGLDTEVLIAKARPEATTADGCSEDGGDYLDPVPAGDAPVLGGCDLISVAMANNGRKPVDVTVLLIDQDFSISTLWPARGTINRIHIGERKQAEVAQIGPRPETASQARLVFVAVPGLGVAHTVFDNLEQEGVRDVTDPGAAPETAAARDLVSTGLNDMARSAVSKPTSLEEEMSVDIRPFAVARQ